MELTIGPSNGWLYAKGIMNLSQHNKILNDGGANAIEVHLGHERNIEKDLLHGAYIDNYTHRSFHLPGLSSDRVTQGILDKVKEFHERHNFHAILLHPDTIDSPQTWRALQLSGLPIAIENMDKRKKSGFRIEELKEIIYKFNFGLVLDVQHAYEHDPTMRYAEMLLEELGDKIVYLHVSGENDQSYHALVKDSTNREEILNFLKKLYSQINVPIILEGDYSNPIELAEEIKLLTEALSN